MKKLLTLFLTSTFVYAFAQVPQKPLVEHFTQASCGPCASQNPTLKATLDAFGTANYVKVTHQVSWPGVDPMNAAYPAGPNDRRNYYGVSGVPDASLNGGATNSPNTAVTSSLLASAAAQTTPYDMEITQTWNTASNLTVDVVIRNTTTAATALADKLHIVMVEDFVSYTTPPGSNGETEFYYVMRNMYNSSGVSTTAGTTIGSIPANDSLVFTFTLKAIPSYIRDLNQVSFAAFLQNNATKTVHQSAKSMAGGFPGLLNVAAASSSTAGSGFCDYSFTPGVSFTNNGSDPITTVTAEYSIDGGTPVSQTFNGSLSMGQSTTIAFPATTLNPGTSVVSYSITDVNNGGTASSPAALAIADEVFNKLSATGSATPVAEGMESSTLISGTGYSRTFPTGLFDAGSVAESSFSILDGPTYNYGAIGGFAQSNRSVRFRFYNITSGSMSIVMDKVNFTTGSQLTFSHAYRQYQAENDRLEVQVSTDCGITWTTVFNEAGVTLSTLPASTTSYVPGPASDWRGNTVDLSAYDNTNDVVIRFRGTSAYGNNLFLDDINMSQATSVKEVSNDLATVEVMPNPTSDVLNVVMENTNFNNYTLTVTNALGQVVKSFTTSNEMTRTIDVSDLNAGIYNVNIATENNVISRRFVVSK